jgi:hypothetical protein
MKHKIKTWSIILFALCLFNVGHSQTKSSCLYKNPLCFFNTDVLNYLQVLHKNQQYNKMTAFFYGSSDRTRQNLEDRLSNANFGYSLKRVGVKEKNKTSWSLTYQRTILGTNETFKIDCALINDTCRVLLDKKAWKILFKE